MKKNFKILKCQHKLDYLIFEMLLFTNLNQNWTNRVIRSIKNIYQIDSLLILFFSPEHFFSFLPQFLVLFLCKYLRVLGRTHWHFSIDYINAWQKFSSFNLKMIFERSKRGCFLTLFFIVEYLTCYLFFRRLKNILMIQLKREKIVNLDANFS